MCVYVSIFTNWTYPWKHHPDWINTAGALAVFPSDPSTPSPTPFSTSWIHFTCLCPLGKRHHIVWIVLLLVSSLSTLCLRDSFLLFVYLWTTRFHCGTVLFSWTYQKIFLILLLMGMGIVYSLGPWQVIANIILAHFFWWVQALLSVKYKLGIEFLSLGIWVYSASIDTAKQFPKV